MADGNPLLEQVKKDVSEGYSKESIIEELKRVGKYDDELRSFLEGEEETEPLKKKSNSQSTTETDTTGSQLGVGTLGSPVSVSTQDVPVWAQTPEQTQAGVPQKEENFVVNQRKKSALGGEMGRVQQEQEIAVNEWIEYKNGNKTLEKPFPPIALPNQPEDFISPHQARFEREQRLYQLNLEIFNAKSADEVRDIILRRNATEINNSYRDAYGKSRVPFGGLGDEKDNLINIVEDENGNLVSSINEGNMSTAIIDIEKAQLNEQKMVEEEQAKLQGMSGIGHVAYDFTTGLMDMTNSFQSLWDREQAQEDIYENTMRTQASYLDYGLSQEEISKGIIQNALDGNFGAASSVFAVQSAQTAPQLLAQAGIAYATAGFGLSTNAATIASSSFMGVSTFGTTWANTYGFVSDEKAFTMALGDAVVEFVSEKLSPSDVKALAGLDEVRGMSVSNIRRTLFGKGLLSTEFKNLAKEKGIDILKGGGSEALEEMFAGIGSQMVHSAVNNEEFNIFEAIDGAIVGFGMGAGSKGVASSRSLLVGGVSALGYGGLRKEINTYKNARQSLAKELSKTTDSAKEEALEAKIKGLDKTIASIGVDMQKVYNQYSDEDANTTISLNQKLSKKIADIRSEQNPEVRKALELEAKQMFAEIQQIEQKYEPVRAKIKEDKRNVASRMTNQTEESVEVDENFQTDGLSIFEGIKNVASSLKGKAKVFVHKSADAAAKAANVSQDDVLGSAGFYVQENGTIHIVPTVAQNNTAYHEGTHKIARSVDPEYISRFVQASLLGMDKQTRAKYEEIQQKYKDDKQLANEEVFSEMVADIADGTISIENQGTSVARAGMKVISDVLAKVGLNKTKVATLKDFSDFVNQVSEDFKTGREVADAPEGVRTAEKKLGEKKALFQLADSDETAAILQSMMELNESMTYDVTAFEENEPTSPKIDIDELNSRLDNKLKFVDPKKFAGVPIMFNISDQLRTGDKVNPLTGNTIDRLKGGLGFHGDEAHSDLGWASIDEDTVNKQLTAAKNIYKKNQEFFDNWWKENPEYDGLIPMMIVKMGQSSIMSNEAVVRVLADNLSSFPEQNKINALNKFIEFTKNAYEKAQRAIESGVNEKGEELKKQTIKIQSDFNRQRMDVLSNIEKLNVTSIDGLLSPEFINSLSSLAAVNKITEVLLTGTPNNIGSTKRVGAPQTEVGKALVEGLPKSEHSKISASVITDIITEPQLKDTPQRTAYMLSSVRVKGDNVGVGKTNHPNYAVGVKGKVIGVFEQPISIIDLFPSVVNNLVLQATLEDLEMAKKTSDASRKTQRIPVQAGLGNLEFQGAKIGDGERNQFSDLLNRSFPFVSFSTDSKLFNSVLNSVNKEYQLKNNNKNTYGISYKGRIFINEEIHNSESELFNTKVHEMGHIWINFLGTTNQGNVIYRKGAELVQQTSEYQKQLKKFDGDEDAAVKETMAILIGNKGELLSSNALSLKNKVKNWISVLFAYVKKHFKMSNDLTTDDIQNMTLNDFLNTALADIMGGRPLKLTPKGQSRVVEARASFRELTSDKKTILHQAGIFKEIADMLASGKKKSEVIADLRERGISKVEAELIYQKALGYKQGMTQGRQAGRKERSAAYAEQKKAEREKESQKVKDFRKRVKKIYEIEGKLNDAFIREFVKLAKELGGAKIKANQLERIIRAVNAASKVRGRKAYEPSIRYAAFNKLVDKVALIIDGAIEAQALVEYGEQLKRVTSLQKELKNKLKSVTATSKNPIVSYSEAVLDLTSIDPTVISMESLDVLESALKDLKNTARNVSVRKGELAAPYIFIEELGENIDLRRAKIYFSEIFDTLHHEATEAQEKQIVEQAIEAAFQNGTDWVTEYNNILQERLKKEMRGAEKRMNEIADEMGLDINDIQDLEGILTMMSEEKKEKLEQEKQAIIDGAIVPTFFNFIREYLNNTHFSEIFGVPESMSEEAMERVIRNRLNNLSGFELKRLEFAMFDYAVNGKAYGITQLSAVIAAKNDGNAKLRKANMVANKPKSSTSNYIYNMFENTPTFFRRVFKKYSLSKVAEFTDALGFARLRSNVSIADTMSDAFGKRVVEKAKELGIDSIGKQVKMQVYSILAQVPEGTPKTMWLRALMGNIDLALESDNRFTDAQKDEIKEALGFLRADGRTRNYDVIMQELESDSKMIEMVNFLRSEFSQQEGGLRDYAEGYLGMKFQSVDNYLPFRFRSTGAMTRSLQELTEGNQTLAQAFRAYNVSQADKQAQSTYERNERAFESKNRYVDLNFLSTITKSYRENQVKVMTAPDVAYISAMTSESNQDFVNSVPDSQIRGAMRRKIYNYLTDGGAMVSRTDSVIGAKMAKAVGRIKDVTVLYYFGSVVNQLFKQSSAIMNATIEGSMNPMELMTTAAQVLTNRLDKGKMALAEKYDIGQRDVVTEIISATSKADAITAGGGFFKKNMDRSTFFLRRTDKAAAFASWFSYYESYMRKNEGLKGSIDWNALAENSNDKAAEYATSMVTKDQNINTSRDKSDFNSLNQSQIGGILQMLVMPFANFLLNKKLNMALDYQKSFSDNADNRKEGLKSLAGSVLEIAAFHSVSQFVIIPMLQAVASGLFGDDEEEDSLFDKEFRMRNFLKGMTTDMNPLVMPIGAMESFYAKGINLLAYVSSGDVDKYSFEDKGFWDGFAAWSKANGLPEFSGVGRDDLGALGFLRQFGVFGDVAVELTTSLVNIASLSEKNPYMTTIYGSTKYLTPEDAKDARMLEFLKASLIISGGVTGLFAKESVQIAKYAEKPLTNRGLSSEKENIGRILTIDKDLGKDLLKDVAYKLKEDNPLSVEPMLNQVLSQSTLKAKVDEKTSDKYVNTIRQIEKMSYDDVRYAALYANKVMDDLTPQEAKEFESELLKFFLIKQGQGSIIRIKNLLNKTEDE